MLRQLVAFAALTATAHAVDCDSSDGWVTGLATWGTFLTKNLFPVTLGNIIGGAVAVALGYTLAYKE